MDGIFYHQPAWTPPAPRLTAVFLALQEVSYRVFDASDEVYYEPREDDAYPYRLSNSAVQVLLSDAPTIVPVPPLAVRMAYVQHETHVVDNDAETDVNFMMYYEQTRRMNVDLLIPPVIPPGPTGAFYHRRRFGSLRS